MTTRTERATYSVPGGRCAVARLDRRPREKVVVVVAVPVWWKTRSKEKKKVNGEIKRRGAEGEKKNQKRESKEGKVKR